MFACDIRCCPDHRCSIRRRESIRRPRRRSAPGGWRTAGIAARDRNSSVQPRPAGFDSLRGARVRDCSRANRSPWHRPPARCRAPTLWRRSRSVRTRRRVVRALPTQARIRPATLPLAQSARWRERLPRLYRPRSRSASSFEYVNLPSGILAAGLDDVEVDAIGYSKAVLVGAVPGDLSLALPGALDIQLAHQLHPEIKDPHGVAAARRLVADPYEF